MTDQLDPLDESAVKQAVDAALKAFADATTLDDLKQAKIDHTGDKSPLALANRAIGSLDKADKAAAGKIVGKSRGQVKQAHDARLAELEAERDAAVLIEEAIDVTLPTDRRPLGARHPLSPHPGTGCGLLRRPRLGGRRRPRDRIRVAELRRAQLRPRPSGPPDAGHLLRRPRRGRPRPAHPHLTRAVALAARTRRAALRRVPGQDLPHR
jgi:hypothetical protein